MLIQFDKDDNGFYSSWCRYLELFFITINIPLICCSLVGIARVHLHFNLKMNILPCFLYILIFHFTVRIFILLYYFGVFTAPVDLDSSFFLVSLSFISVYSLTYVCIAMAGAFIERCLATHYVEDYERHPRRYIGYYCLLTFPISLVITIPVFMEWIHWGLLIVVDVSCGFLAAWGCIFLYHRNKRNYKHLMSSPVAKGYSLSQRWQMDENIATLKLIKNIVILTGFCPAVNTFAYIMMMIDENAAFYRSLFYLSISIESFLMIGVGALSPPQIQEAICRPFTKKKAAVSAMDDTKEKTDQYFRSLMEQWENNFDKALSNE